MGAPGVTHDVKHGAGAEPDARPGAPARIALVGMPNTGKTTLFNRLTGLRHKTSNFPGTTVEARVGAFRLDGGAIATARGDCCGQDGGGTPAREYNDAQDHAGGAGVLELVDLPGVYSLELNQIESAIARDVLAGRTALRREVLRAPDAVCLVLDATNLARNLMLAGETLRRRLPTVVAVNMIDLAARQGLHVDAAKLAESLGCPVVLINARTGDGLTFLRAALARAAASGAVPTRTPPGGATLHEEESALRRWADGVFAASCAADPRVDARRRELHQQRTDRADLLLTHPVLGLAVFAVIMAGLFYAIFTLAQYPMEWIDAIFGSLGGAVDWLWAALGLPMGFLHDLLKDGVVAGVGATVIFLPQICLLFFLISLLEDTGYLSRAAFVMDRVLRPFGLPGHAFVPLLSSHGCALPGIMATRCIPDPRERLATILVAPFMTCSARLPVYVLLTGLLFAGRPLLAALAFVGCYALGIAAALLSALLARRTVLRGPARPMALELPSYKRPSLRTALITTYDRGMTFVKKAGTMILAVSILLWWLGSFPKVEAPAEATRLREAATSVRAGGAAVTDLSDPDLSAQWAAMPEAERRKAQASHLEGRANALEAKHAKRESFVGRLGRAGAPVFAPIGADWQLTVGILASFAAREVFVSTMTVIVAGSEDDDDDTIRRTLETATRDDGTKLFAPATAWAMLVFYVLAMQCLPTLVVTAREAGHWKWAALQFAWMSALAYGAAALVFQFAS